MKKTTRKLLSLAMASAMAASLLTGCGGGGAGETPDFSGIFLQFFSAEIPSGAFFLRILPHTL